MRYMAWPAGNERLKSQSITHVHISPACTRLHQHFRAVFSVFPARLVDMHENIRGEISARLKYSARNPCVLYSLEGYTYNCRLSARFLPAPLSPPLISGHPPPVSFHPSIYSPVVSSSIRRFHISAPPFLHRGIIRCAHRHVERR